MVNTSCKQTNISNNNPKEQLIQLLCCSVFLFIVLICSAPGHADALTATVDRDKLALNESLTLRLRYEGSIKANQPDFNLLQRNFEILSRRQSNQYRMINGETESFIEWTLSLAPLKEGKLFIPSFHLNNEISNAIPIEVNKASQPSSTDPNRQAFLEIELDKKQLYVQEQLLVKVRLYTTVGLHDISMEPLQIPDTHIEKVDEQNYERRINGVAHAVHEIIYAVFPENSGTLQIPALNYVAIVGPRDPFSLLNRNTQRLRLRSKAKTLDVIPRPKNYTGSQWLPAAGLNLKQSWSHDPKNFKVGEPISRIITLSAEGLRAAQLPPLPALQVEGLKTYPNQPQQEDQASSQGITGSSTETTAIVATKPGKYQLPPISVTWWDSKTQQQRTTELPAFQFQVKGAASVTTPPPQSNGEAAPNQTMAAVDPGFWRTLAIIAIASHLLWLIYLFKTRKKLLTSKKPDDNTSASLHRVTAQLKQALRDGIPINIQKALINWLNIRWPEAKGNNLGEINRVLDFKEIAEIQNLLNGTLYLTSPQPLDKKRLDTLIQQLLKRQKSTATDDQPNLPDLFSPPRAK